MRFKNTDAFFAHVQANGFNGLAPGKGDLLGDRWASAIGKEFDRVAVSLPHGPNRHNAWLIFQWLYCLLAKMESRVIASPPAIRAAGIDLTEEQIQLALELLWKTTEE